MKKQRKYENFRKTSETEIYCKVNIVQGQAFSPAYKLENQYIIQNRSQILTNINGCTITNPFSKRS